jgi:hypothetical protein
MATGDRIDNVAPHRFQRENGPAQYCNLLPAAGVTAINGVPLHKSATDGFQFLTRVPTNGTPLGTGLTVQLALVDDPNLPGLGLVANLGVTIKRLVADGDVTQTLPGVELVVPVTMSATSGGIAYGSFAVTKANISASLVAGENVLIRVRRLGTAAADTHTGTVLVLQASVSDT